MQSEYATLPSSVILHDCASALPVLKQASDADELHTKYLFRFQPDVNVFQKQHRAFYETVKAHVPVTYLLSELLASPDFAINPNQVYTRDSAITIPWSPNLYIECRMGTAIRLHEPANMTKALNKLGLQTFLTLPDDAVLEGGDVIPTVLNGKRTLLVGYERRTNMQAVRFLAHKLIPDYVDEIIALRLAEWRINLDGCFVQLADNVAVCHPESIIDARHFSENGNEPIDWFEYLNKSKVKLVTVSKDDSIYRQACNFFCLGDRRVIGYDLCPKVSQQIKKHNIEVITVAGSELVKGTGGPRCMTRPIYI